MCWLCDLRQAADDGVIPDHRQAWARLVDEYARRHDLTGAAANAALLENIKPMPELYQ
jgi:hypothetical protein